MMSEIKNEIEKFWDNKDSINFSDEDIKKDFICSRISRFR